MSLERSISKWGYRDDSPYRGAPSLDIHTATGLIDMSHTGMPIVANGRLLAPYSGLHQFEAGVVREIPVRTEGGVDVLKKKRISCLIH